MSGWLQKWKDFFFFFFFLEDTDSGSEVSAAADPGCVF